MFNRNVHFSNRRWNKVAQFDKKKVLPKNLPQIEKALGISNALFLNAPATARPHLLAIGKSNLAWVKPQVKGEQLAGCKRKAVGGEKQKQAKKVKSKAATPPTKSKPIQQTLIDELDETDSVEDADHAPEGTYRAPTPPRDVETDRVVSPFVEEVYHEPTPHSSPDLNQSTQDETTLYEAQAKPMLASMK